MASDPRTLPCRISERVWGQRRAGPAGSRRGFRRLTRDADYLAQTHSAHRAEKPRGLGAGAVRGQGAASVISGGRTGTQGGTAAIGDPVLLRARGAGRGSVRVCSRARRGKRGWVERAVISTRSFGSKEDRT